MEYRKIEDLWLSFIVKKVLKGSTYRLYTLPELDIGEPEVIDQTALYTKLHVEKNDMLKVLIENNYLSHLEPTFNGLLAVGEVFYHEPLFIKTILKTRVNN